MLVGRIEAGKKRVRQIYPSENQSQQPKDRHFSVDPRVLATTLLGARDRGDDLIGFFHSHPAASALPSRADREAAWQDCSYLILGSEGRLRCFCPRGDRGWNEERVVAEIESGE